MITLSAPPIPGKNQLAATMVDFSARIDPSKGAVRQGRASHAKLTPVPRETVQDRVYMELRKALIYGVFEPGQVLIIQDLAASLATSTMPVREALSRLISEQALETMPNRSIRVPLVDIMRLDDLLRARIVIEGTALELATPRLQDHEIEQLKVLIGDYDRAMSNRKEILIDFELELNRSFHFLIYQAAGSSVLIPIIESLWLQSGPYVRAAALAFDPGGEISSQHYHAQIIKALEARDVAAAKQALATDISRAFDLLRRPHPVRTDVLSKEANA
jgi:DNA-binding GntR family transcriptional regulator